MTHPSRPNPDWKISGIFCRQSAIKPFLAACLMGLVSALAAEPIKREFNLPAGSAEDSLKRLAVQSGREVLFSPDAVEGVKTRAVKGEMTPKQALDAMLAGTGLVGVIDEKTGGLTVRREDGDPNGARATPLTGGDRPNPARNRADETGAGRGAVEPPITLSPFEVQADAASNYSTLNSNSITGFNLPLTRLPVSADILDQTFLSDVGGDNFFTILQTYTTSATFAPLSSATAAAQPLDALDSTTAIRGLTAPAFLRDALLPAGSLTGGYGSSFSMERMETIKGPQSLLYGNGSGGGAINMVSKQARFDQRAAGSVDFQVDQYGHRAGRMDFRIGTKKIAAVISYVDQDVGNRQVFIGGPMRGIYGQLALRLPFGTTLRFGAEHTLFHRFVPNSLGLTAASTANDARNGRNLVYLLATNQINASASGPSGAGTILNGKLTLDNANSFGGRLSQTRLSTDYDVLSLDTQWARWFSTQLTAAASFTANNNAKQSYALYAPNHPLNRTGDWAMGSTAALSIAPRETDLWQKGIRFSGLLMNDLFQGRVTSKTMFGAEFKRASTLNAAKGFYQADSNWNVIRNPAVSANYGRTLLPAQYWSVADGPVKYPLYNPYSPRLTVNGINYVQEMANRIDRSLVSPQNPLGVTSTVSTDVYTFTHTINRGYFAVNHSQWGRNLSTMAGVRQSQYYSQNVTGTTRTRQVIDNNSTSFNLGAAYALTHWLSPYVGLSDSFNQPTSLSNDPYGAQPKVSHSIGGEVGVKFANPTGSVSGTLALYHVRSKDNQYLADSTIVSEINPEGLNGSFGSSRNTPVTVDLVSRGAELILTGSPTKNWRTRFGASLVDAGVGTTKEFALLYNDQFHTNTQGQVTYRDGSVVYVNSTYSPSQPVVTAGTAGAIPLTLALLNTPGSPYYANPVAVSGQINRGSAVANVLQQVDPVHGPILTGAVGLPITAIQISPGFTPPAALRIVTAGSRNTGSPKISASLTNIYTFSSGWLKGFRAGGTLGLAWKRIQFYYYPNGVDPFKPTVPYYMPTVARFDLILGYERRFERVTWDVQLNVGNLFNHYHLLVYPNPTTGWNGINTAGYDTQPRAYVLRTGLKF